MEFELKGQAYTVGKINALQQFHILRRLAPMLGGIAPQLKTVLPKLKNKDVTADEKMALGMDLLPGVIEAIGKLSDEDSEYVLFGLLKAVQRKQSQGLGWGPVSTERSLMYEDIDMAAMLQLAAKALMFNLSGFFDTLPSTLPEESPTPSE